MLKSFYEVIFLRIANEWKDYEILDMSAVSEVQNKDSKSDDTDLIDIDSLYETDTSLQDLY